jgi:uncharacterized membrane protein YuzA (DUF378 family)
MAALNPHITERRHLPDRRSAAGHIGGRRLGAVDWIAMVLMIIGGINWGLVGLMNIDLVATLFGEMSNASRVIYALVGLSALYSIYTLSKMAGDHHY